MIKFVNSKLYFDQDETNFTNPLLQVGSGGPKINGSDRIRILIPVHDIVRRHIIILSSVLFVYLH